MAQKMHHRLIHHWMATTVGLLLMVVYVFGECNICSLTNHLACVSGTKFKVCLNGIPQGNNYSCPDNTVCSTVGAGICQSPGVNTVEDCQECNTCDETNTFACTSVNTFSLCLGENYPSQLTGSCQPNYVCNIHNAYICGDNTTGIAPPTCSYEDVAPTLAPSTTTVAPSTTPNPNTDPVGFCQIVKENRRYPLGTQISTTCKQYVYCFQKNGVWTGQTYQCPGNTYFNSSSSLCGRNIPPRCTNAVRSLSLLQFQLT